VTKVPDPTTALIAPAPKPASRINSACERGTEKSLSGSTSVEI
jgi:hypothetical protein